MSRLLEVRFRSVFFGRRADLRLLRLLGRLRADRLSLLTAQQTDASTIN